VWSGGTVTLTCTFAYYVTPVTGTCANGVLTWSVGGTTGPPIGYCQPVNGGIGGIVLFPEAGLTTSSLSLSQTAGAVTAFPTATSILTAVLFTPPPFGADTNIRQTLTLQPGYAHQVTVSNCASSLCVQNVINYWRCKGLTVDCSGFTCWFNSAQIACPTSALGWTCPNGSKKGLLLLLLLLLLIPVVLSSLLLCLLCLLRRKKTGGDVHFATFDPSAGPALGPVVAGTLGGMGGMGGMPMASVPVAF